MLARSVLMAEPTHKTMIYLPLPVYETLRRIAFEERTSINKLVREGVEHTLARRAKAKTKKET